MLASELAALVDGELVGDDRAFSGVTALDQARPDAASFALAAVPSGCEAGVLLLSKPHPGRTVVLVDDPKAAFITLLEALFPTEHEPGVHGDATVHPTAELGPGVVVSAGVRIGARCTVGADTVLFPNVVLYPDTVVGQRCRIHAGVVLGGDGFGYHPTATGLRKVPQVGRVRLGDDVEIGANCTVDRAFLHETVLESGVKLDDLVHIGHNVRVGQFTVIAAQTGISGSVDVGAGVQLGGQVGIADHARLGDGVMVGAQSGVHGVLPPGTAWLGTPALPLRLARRVYATFKRLPEMWRQMDLP